MLFSTPLILDYDTLEAFIEDQKQQADQVAQAAQQPDQPEAEPPPESGRT